MTKCKTGYERIMACIPPNPRRVGYIVPIHGPLCGPLYMGSIYSNSLVKAQRYKHEIILKTEVDHTCLTI